MSKSDLFATQASFYRDFRPTYPAALFDWLAAEAPARGLAWDCACGSGQATLDLATRFERVIATDSSVPQLEQAELRPNIEYRCEPAEASSIAAGTVDLTLVAQALHWFDHPAFFAEVRRVSRPGALFAAVTYNLLSVSPALDAVIADLYWRTLAGCWAPERRHVEEGYRSIAMPFEAVAAPPFELEATWSYAQLTGYLHSWSAVATYRKRNGTDPVPALEPALAAAWGDAAERTVRFPLSVLAGRV
ncbi:MAG TPA: class I SAM-dependent methyltransferase [Telluria sp.]|nr:class I SAM-dependent methyltransferase [Telluria sp.]